MNQISSSQGRARTYTDLYYLSVCRIENVECRGQLLWGPGVEGLCESSGGVVDVNSNPTPYDRDRSEIDIFRHLFPRRSQVQI